MFHATIRTVAQDAVRISGEVSPYNVQLLRDRAARRGPGTRLELRAASTLHSTLLRALRDLDRHGVVVVLEKP